MKLTTIFLLAALLHVSGKGLTQKVSLSEKNVSLEKVFKEIRRQSGYEILYNTRQIQSAPKVSVNLENVSVEEAMKLCLRETNLTYRIEDKVIVIAPKEVPKSPVITESLSPRLDVPAPPPTRDITGRITDENGNFLRGAAIKIKGTQKGATTNAEGIFSLKGIDEDVVLEISFVGYETMTISVKGRKEFEFALKAKEASLQEVVINKGYYTEKQRFSVGNTVKVDAKEIEKHPVPNIMTAIQGLAPGLEIIQSSGMNGGNVSFRIQGRNSINNGLDPLVLVDGVPIPSQMVALTPIGGGLIARDDLNLLKGGSPLNYLNPSDIESVEILKDADATAMYGSRAANGAVLITTKKGKAGKTRITVNMQQGWSQKTQSANMMNTQQYLSMRREAIKNDNKIPSSNPLATAPFIYAPDLTVWDTTRYTDWQKELTGGTAQYTMVNAGISGGNSTLQFLINSTYNRRTTVFPGSYADENGTVHFNISGSSNNQKFKAILTGSYTMGTNNLPGIDYTQTAIQLEPNAPALYNSDGTLNWAPDASGTSTWLNPLARLFGNDFILTSKSLSSNLSLSYKVYHDLTLYTDLGFTNLDNVNTLLSRLDQYRPESRASRQRTTALRYSNTKTWLVEPKLVYNHTFGKGQVDALVGTNIQKNTYDYLGLFGSGYSSDAVMKTLFAASTISLTSNVTGVTRYNSLYARAGYNYDGKYLLNLTYRRDGSNKFGDNNKFGDFWSGGLGWIFSEESWMHKHSWLSFGKLKLTYGVTGNDQIADFSYLTVFNLANPGVPYQGVAGWYPNNIANPYLQWERTKKLQGGIDLGFFDERINLSAGYALNRSDNQLVSYPLTNVTGFSSIVINRQSVVQNTSLELSLTTLNVKTKNVSWTTRFNITLPQNKLVSFPGIENTSYASGASGLIVGQPVGIKKVGHFMGINSLDGWVLVADKNGNPVHSLYSAYAADGTNHTHVLINTNPQYYGGFNSSLKYKGLQLDAFFYYKRGIGANLLEWTNGATGAGMLGTGNGASGTGNQPATAFNRWQNPGDIYAHNPKYSTSSNYASYIENTDAFYSYDASFIRLKNISISWQVPKSFLQKTRIENLFISLLAENIATITKYSGLDPESGTGLPPLRTITLQAKLDF